MYAALKAYPHRYFGEGKHLYTFSALKCFAVELYIEYGLTVHEMSKTIYL